MKESDDLAALQSIVKIDLPITAIRWEIFGTPEYVGGVPGPTDYITLIGEAESSAPSNAPNIVAAGMVWVTPNAVRPWLSSGFQAFLTKHANSQVDLTSLKDCSPLQARLVKTGKFVKGFSCNVAGKSLVYFTLFSSFE